MKNILKNIVVTILTWEARLVLRKYNPKIIAVTGSMGKTSAKDAIYTALSEMYFVRKSEKSFNSDIGVPLTILGQDNAWNNPLKWIANFFEGLALVLLKNHYPRWLVLEVGADRPGDIARVARWLKPDIAVITGIPDTPAHVEFFDSADAVAAEKRVLADALRPSGILILNGDDGRAAAIRETFRGNSVTYGIGGHNTFSASHIAIVQEKGRPTGLRFRVNHNGSSAPLEVVGTIGQPHVYSMLAALAVGVSVGGDIVSLSQTLTGFTPPPGRMRLLGGIKGSTIIDDTYNAAPMPALAALDAIEKVTVQKGRKIVILGDMMELGRSSVDAHKVVGARVAGVADMLITVGIRARDIAQAALDNGMEDIAVRQYESNEAARAGAEIQNELEEGDMVLVKGSQAVRMERAVKEIMAEPMRARELLVRQDREWLAR